MALTIFVAIPVLSRSGATNTRLVSYSTCSSSSVSDPAN